MKYSGYNYSLVNSAKNASLKTVIFMAIFLFASFSAYSAENSEDEQKGPRWFEVEIILYKSNSELGLTNESWNTNSKVELPSEIIDFLQPYSQPEPLTDEQLAASNDEFKIQSVTSLSSSAKTGETKKNGSPEELFLTEEITDLSESIETEQPFALLDEELLQLKEEAKRISNNKNYTLVSHFSWRQPVQSRRQSQSIRIAGGIDFHEDFNYHGTEIVKYPTADELSELATDEITDVTLDEQMTNGRQTGNFISRPSNNAQNADANSMIKNQTDGSSQDVSDTQTSTQDNAQIFRERANIEFVSVPLPWVPEIDGSMRVYIQRNYLHIDSKLFYRRPDKEEVSALKLTDSLFSIENSQTGFGITETLNSEKLMTENTVEESLKVNDPVLQPTSSVSEFNNPKIANFGWQYDDNFLQQEIEKIYITRLFNYSFNQTRRLRSGELHYFDHPLIGMLVMIRPYEKPSDNDNSNEQIETVQSLKSTFNSQTAMPATSL